MVKQIAFELKVLCLNLTKVVAAIEVAFIGVFLGVGLVFLHLITTEGKIEIAWQIIRATL